MGLGGSCVFDQRWFVSRQFKAGQFRQSGAVERLQSTREASGAGHDRSYLLFPLSPCSRYGGPFFRKISLHLLKLFGDCRHDIMKLRARKVLEDPRFLIILCCQGEARSREH